MSGTRQFSDTGPVKVPDNQTFRKFSAVLIDTDIAMKEASMRAVEAENSLKIAKLEIDRISDLLSSRTTECETLREEIKQLKTDLEDTKRQTKHVQHSRNEEKLKFENDREIIRLEFGKQINELKVELEKFKSAYRKATIQLDNIKRNADKRGQMAENAEKCANEKIEGRVVRNVIL